MVGSFLVAERDRLLALVEQVRAAGEVAPAYCWLTETSSTKAGKTYTYVILVTQKPDCKPTSQSLGRPGSLCHCHWRAAIERREAVVELEQQLAILQGLIERQRKAWKNANIAHWLTPA